METKATEHFHPEWRAALDSQATRDGVLEQDARKTTRAIQSPVESEDQAADAFDDIPYVKGQAVVRMLEAWLGEDSFRRGVRAYMAAHRFGNTTGANLWVALEKASGKPVARLATDWTAQPGYPLLKVAQVCEQGWRRITLSQEQYWLDEQPSRGAAVAGAGGAGGRGRQDHVHAADGPEHDHLPARLRGHAGGRSGRRRLLPGAVRQRFVCGAGREQRETGRQRAPAPAQRYLEPGAVGPPAAGRLGRAGRHLSERIARGHLARARVPAASARRDGRRHARAGGGAALCAHAGRSRLCPSGLG
ncbi:hypothetical protein LP419_08290 [Massilia sp. H-1]|nr:hypothetical protein LP419_08290 [Massilia sp. H-1]